MHHIFRENTFEVSVSLNEDGARTGELSRRSVDINKQRLAWPELARPWVGGSVRNSCKSQASVCAYIPYKQKARSLRCTVVVGRWSLRLFARFCTIKSHATSPHDFSDELPSPGASSESSCSMAAVALDRHCCWIALLLVTAAVRVSEPVRSQGRRAGRGHGHACHPSIAAGIWVTAIMSLLHVLAICERPIQRQCRTANHSIAFTGHRRVVFPYT